MNNQEMARQYLDLRAELARRFSVMSESEIDGPVKILYYHFNGVTYDLKVDQIHPGDTFTGKFILLSRAYD